MQSLVLILVVAPVLALRFIQLGRARFETASLHVWDLLYTLAAAVAIDVYWGVYLTTVFFSVAMVIWGLTMIFGDPAFDRGQLKVVDLFYAFMAFAMAVAYTEYLAPPFSGFLQELSLIASVREWSGQHSLFLQWALYVTLSDALTWASHRFMHTRLMWRFHAMHHSSEQINWLSGQRATVVHVFVLFIPYTIAASMFIVDDTAFAVLALATFDAFNQHFIHSNIKIPFARGLEKLFVTPRVHLIHHNREARISNSNYAFIFTIFDRMLGTYTDPDSVEDKRFGVVDGPGVNLDPISMNFGFDLFYLFRHKRTA